MITNPDVRDLDRHLDDWLFRLRMRDALLWAVRGLTGGAALALGLTLMARFRPLLPVPALVLLSLSFTLAGFALAVGLAYFWPRPRLASARYFDRLFGLAERTSTALELAQAKLPVADWLARDQWADAAAAARGAAPAYHLPFRVDRRDVLSLFIVAALLTLSIALPNSQQAILAQQQALQQTIAEQIEQLQAAQEEILNNPNLTEAQKEELVKPLEEAQQALEEGDLTQEQALQALTEAQQELQALTDSNALDQAQALQDAGEGLSQNTTTQPAGEALQNGDLQGAAEALSNIDLSQLSEAELQALADQLEQTAQQLQSTNPATAAQLQAAADALNNGDVAAAQAALDQAAQSVSQTASDAAQAQAAAAAAGQVSEAQQAVAQAGSEGNPGQGQGQGDGQGQGQGQGDGQGQGQGDGQGQGQGDGQGQGSGGGAGQGTGDGGQGGGSEAGTDPIDQNNGAGDGGLAGYEEIYSPYLLGGEGGSDVNLPTSGDPNGEVVGEGPSGEQDAGDVTVPYVSVLPGYTDAAYEAVDSGDYPANLSDVIKQYFSSLQP